MRDHSLAPEVAANERKGYELYKRDAIALTRRITDPVLRDRAIGHLIDLCEDGGDEGEASALFDLLQSDSVRREIAARHEVRDSGEKATKKHHRPLKSPGLV